jgi:hypothetical protein
MYKIINYIRYNNISKILSYTNVINIINKFNTEKSPVLGRWCHVNIPNCNHDVLIKKIDMANRDNNFCIKPKTLTKL